jgi:ABC-type multidrug transport system ATPase subunit
VLIVGEPTVGLDPEERMGFRLLLAELAGEQLRFHGAPEALIAA